MRRPHLIAGAVALFFACVPTAQAAETYSITDAPSLDALAVPNLGEIVIGEIKGDDASSPVGLVPFAEWAEKWPAQKRFLSPFPAYVEPTVNITADGMTKPAVEKLLMYVTEARFVVPAPPQSLDLSKYTNTDFLARLDPAIEHHLITPAAADNVANKNPGRQWCEPEAEIVCVQSKYNLEGKLPMAVHLVDQLTDDRKLYDYLEFQSELRVVPHDELDQQALGQLTGITTPVTGAIEQTIFHINQIMQFGKFLAVLQPDPYNPNATAVTAFVALALKARHIENAKKYENVPVLRNLVPGMVLAGKSSFNTGRSISAGLPVFARNNIIAVASILAEGAPSCPSCAVAQNCAPATSAVQRDSDSAMSSSRMALPVSLTLESALSPDPPAPCSLDWTSPSPDTSCGCPHSVVKACIACPTMGGTPAHPAPAPILIQWVQEVSTGSVAASNTPAKD